VGISTGGPGISHGGVLGGPLRIFLCGNPLKEFLEGFNWKITFEGSSGNSPLMGCLRGSSRVPWETLCVLLGVPLGVTRVP
jgi:hypothetical protein